ncbi:hypothetical protein K2173_003299 [Erythroxylum novogranatense]|uniref:YTH domain-containing family protein n=1 Tax=Erythroxylum novogranatense TaxID=1862640 RepID=A0AAV8SY36_9ROSI|nr:hypothetical protein K2173_003299 [Erythroxylum novogranatense]
MVISLTASENVIDVSSARRWKMELLLQRLMFLLMHVSLMPTQSIVKVSYNDVIGRWGTCHPDVDAQGLEIDPRGVFNDSFSPLFNGYGHTREIVQRPYAPFSTSLPFVSDHDQSYNGQGFSKPDSHYNQHVIPSKNHFAALQNAIPQTSSAVNIDPQVDGKMFWARPGYMPGSFCRGSNFSANSGELDLLQQGFEGFESGELWSDCPKSMNNKSSFVHLSSSSAIGKPIDSLGLSGLASQQKDSFYGFGSHLDSRYKSYTRNPIDGSPRYEVESSSTRGTDGQNWSSLDEARQERSCNCFSCNCANSLDTIGEWNRGPRALKPRSQTMANRSDVDGCGAAVSYVTKSYNQVEFVTVYKDAKFFVIKSYSEDNVHKSIKYGVWASTQNGNRKLDAAYREAKEKHETFPVFLLFSVNASAQFCGVAEMVGPVDFDKSVDYWQQDKWSGQFPVRWQIIKDVPNSQFRHIVLENNDKKPVTNSRDTQEVELNQGIEMLNIFKNYESHSSILDDFLFYEERQKAIQATKSKQPKTLLSNAVKGQNPVSRSTDFVQKLSKSFAEAVSCNEKKMVSHLQQKTIGVDREIRS